MMVRADNAEELALIAEEIGAEVIRGPVRYPSETGGIEVGGVDIGERPRGLTHTTCRKCVRPRREEWKHGDFSALL